MKSRTISKSDIKEINSKLRESFEIEPLNKKDKVILVQDDIEFLKVNGDIDYFYADEKIIPTLKNLLKNNFLKKITVDMGAVKFVVSGADIMRPGIVDIDEGIKKDDIISVIDMNNKKPLAIGIALNNTEDMKSAESGKSIKNIHFVGDHIWKLE